MLGSPIPIIVGICESLKYVAKNILPDFGCNSSNNDIVYYFLEEKWILADADLINKTPVIDFNGFFVEFRNKFKNVFSKNPSRVLKIKTHRNGSKTFSPKNKKFGIKEALNYKSGGLRRKLADRLGFMKTRKSDAAENKPSSQRLAKRPSIYKSMSPTKKINLDPIIGNLCSLQQVNFFLLKKSVGSVW